MQGSINVESVEGEGSTFWFTATFPRQQSSEIPEPAGTEEFRHLRVLVVDDSELNRRIIRLQLESWGCDVTEAEDGSRAMELLRANGNTQQFKVAIIDYMMPHMDGEELGKRIMAELQGRKPSLLLLTSSARRGDAQRMLKAGFSAYLPKPVKQSTLFEAIATVLGTTREDCGGELTPRSLVTQHSLSENQRKRSRILLAEDNKVNQKVAVRMLEKAGYNVQVAENGAIALEQVKAADFHVVLMDMHMPEMDGIEATRRIRALDGDRRGVKIIAMTANAMAGDREVCIRAGMDDYLSKPVNASELFAKLEEHLHDVYHRESGPDILLDAVNMEAEEVSGVEAPTGKGNIVSAVAAVEEPVDAETDEESVDKAVVGDFDAPLDYAQSVELAGDEEFWKELFAIFTTETERRIAELSTAVEERDVERIVREAHTIKGSAAEICAEPLREAALALELAGKAGEDEKLVGLLRQVAGEYERLHAYVRDVAV
jgi:CheY-like chemotaxis protein/HPt (histidine-containing phosphotransfer) domain-containing protein